MNPTLQLTKGAYQILRRFIKAFSLSFVVMLAAGTCSAFGMPTEGSVEAKSKIAAVVIDDFGNDMLGTKEMMELPIPFTAAVMPFLPTSKRDAQWAHRSGRDVIIHLPMEPVKGKKSWLGPGAITVDLPDDEIRRRVEAAIADVPYAIGMNNHMGSKATADPRVMRIVLQVCKERGFFFLDSRTSSKSVIPALGKELGVEVVHNGLFFDEVYTIRHISKQVFRFNKLLQDQGACVAIGHVGPPGQKTAALLKQYYDEVKGKVEFVPVSKLITVKDRLVNRSLSP